MKNFIILIFKYSVLICLVIALICEVHIPDKKVVELVPRDYSKVIWNINAINKRPEIFKESIVFIGSSLVNEGISDSLLCSRGIKAVNLGVSRAGFDLDYYFTQRILKFNPKSIYLVRMPNGSSLSHPVTPLLMSPLEHLRTFKQLNFDFITSYIPKRLYFVINSFFLVQKSATKTQLKLYGSSSAVNKDFKMDDKTLNIFIEKSLFKVKKIEFEYIDLDGIHKTRGALKNLCRKFNAFFVSGNAELIRTQNAQICTKKNIFVNEIYIPNFANAYLNRKKIYTSKTFLAHPKLRCIHINDVSFLNNFNYWNNLDHLNYDGALIFTDSLITRIIAK
jgi:hypothetical protein